MKTLDNAICLKKACLRAVECGDGPIVEMSNTMSLPHHQLKEILLMPQDGPVITKKFLEQAECHSIKDLLAICQGQSSILYRDHLFLLKEKILGYFFLNLPWQSASWYFSVLDTDQGSVISVVVGNHVAVEKMHERKKQQPRRRPVLHVV